ncbi:fibronectin type III domain-containing protein [Fibrella aquatica]|uniref:fibronectin type III domain-containing protein n=1 Tax=Fibrella aquatica TaxID=3242487 RepID=UPI0035219B94
MTFRYLLIALLGVISRFGLAQSVCQVPQSTYTGTPSSRAVSISWSYYGGGSPTYQVQFRFAGQIGWTSNGVSRSSSVTLSNLAPRTGYEWRVRSICAAGDTSAFTNPLSFSTECRTPQGLYNSTISAESAQVSWSFYGDGSPTYQMQYRATGAADWISRPVQSSSYGTITNLINNTDYQWRVRSICSPGDSSAFSAPISFRTVCYSPGGTYTSDLTYRSARLNWYSGPSGASYEVYWRVAGATDWTSVNANPNTSMTLNGLANNTTYEWKVRSVCSANATSAFTSPITFQTQCLAPNSLYTTVPNTDIAELRWTNPAGVFATDLRWRAIGATNWVEMANLASNDFGLTGLTPNASYEWQVRSSCSATDKSAWSQSVQFITWCDQPNNVTSSNIGSSRADLSWSAKTVATLQYRLANASTWTTINTVSSPYTLTGLSNNTVYEWRVATACAEGVTSDYSATQLFTTRCDRPQYSSASINTDNAINFSWGGPSDGVYELQWRVAGTTSWTSVDGIINTGYTLNSPTLNTTYEWRVRRACSSTDFSDFTPTNLILVTCQSAYLSPYSYKLTSNSVGLSWSTYSNRPTDTYELQWRPASTTVWTTVTGLTTSPYTLTGLTPGVPYQWRVRRMCTPTIGSDYTSTIESFTIPCNQPTSFYITSVATTTASIQWYGNDSYPPYDLNYRPVGQANWIALTSINASAFSLTGLTPNTVYEWQVRSACSTTGTAPAFGAIQSFVTYCGGTPTDFSIVSVIAGNVTVRWSGGAGVASYEIYYREVGSTNWLTKTVPANEVDQPQGQSSITKQYTFYGLPTGKNYEWRVRSICEAGISSPFADGPVMTTNCPSTGGTGYAYQVDNTRANIVWSMLGSTDTYDIQWRQQGASTWLTEQAITGSTYTLTNLQPGFTYEYTVQRVCAPGLKSDVVGNSVSIRYQVPTDLSVRFRSGNSVNVTWKYPAASSTELTATAFTIQYRLAGTTSWTTVNVPAATAVGQYPSLSVPVLGLTVGAAYEFQVRAGAVGQPGSDYTYAAYYAVSCSVVGSVQTAVGTTSANVSWYAPSTDIPFQLQWRPVGSFTWTTVAIPGTTSGTTVVYSLTGLANNSSYEWRVATNCGDGVLSDYTAIQSFMTGCVVTAASSVYATAAATSANITWSYYPATLAKSIVQYRLVNAVTWIDGSPQTSTSYSLTGLTPNAAYQVRIRSVCEGGDIWAVSSVSSFQTVCRAVSSFSVYSIQERLARIIWSASESPTVIQWRQVGGASWSEAIANGSLVDITGLTPGTAYEYRFQTTCSPGSSPVYSATGTFTTSMTSLPTVSLRADSTGIDVARLLISNNDQTAYRLQWRGVGTSSWFTTGLLTSTTYLLQNLTPGTTYEARLVQTSGNSTTVYSNTTQFSMDCPTFTTLTITSLSTQAAWLSWSLTKPMPVVVQWRVGGSASWNTVSVPAGVTIHSLTGLSPATSYEWRATPTCSAASGAFTPVGTFRTPASCQAPVDGSTTDVNLSSAKLYWSAYSNPTQFTVRYRVVGTTNWTVRTGIISSPFTLTGLSANTTYDWAVADQCSGNTALMFSSPRRFTTQCLPAYYATTQAVSTQARLTWSEGGPDYVVRWRRSGASQWNQATTSAKSFTLSGLEPSTYYDWQVRSACTPEFSGFNWTTFSTQCGDSFIYSQTARPVGTNAVSLTWTTNYGTADLNVYTVGWRVKGTTNWTTRSGVVAPYMLTGLADNTTYEWQVRPDCSTQFNAPLTFQTTCALVTNQRVDQQTSSTAQLVWSDAFSGTPYVLQWREAGVDTWNTVSGINGTSYTLTGLTNGTSYEWQVRGACAGVSSYLTTTAFKVISERQTSVYTVKTGSWNDATVWSCNCIPTPTDAVLIKHAVTIPASYTGYTKRIFYEGAGQLKISGASVVKPTQ